MKHTSYLSLIESCGQPHEQNGTPINKARPLG